METVLSGVIVLFIVLFAVFTLTYAGITSQITLYDAQADAQSRMIGQAGAQLSVLAARTVADRELVELTLKNTGSTRLASFDRWDLVLKYDDAASGAAHIEYLRLDPSLSFADDAATIWGFLADRAWGGKFYADAAADLDELAEPEILNAGEEMIVWARPSDVIEPGSAIELSLATEYGSSLFTSLRANYPPELVHHSLEIGRSQTSVTLAAEHLLSTDADDPAAALVYTLTDSAMLPGALSAETFTQADVDAGAITYTRAPESDGGVALFTVTDGKDTLRNQEFTVTISEPPAYTPDSTAIMLASGDPLPVTCMRVTDPDDDAAALVYTLTAPTSAGTLHLDGSAALAAGSTFTAADVAAGRVTYQRDEDVEDGFSFTISDGENMIGPYSVTLLEPLG